MWKTYSRFVIAFTVEAILILLVGAGLYLWDQSNVVVFQAMGIAIIFAGTTHLTRRILMPKIDIQDVAHRAVVEGNLGAAVIFVAMIAFLIAAMYIPLLVLR